MRRVPRREARRRRPTAESLEDRRVPTTLPAGFAESAFASGLDAPTAMEFAPDGRLFVAEQDGELRVVADGQLLPTPFVSLDVDSRGERGLLGVAFDPQFSTNHYVYVYYTVPGATAHNRVSRFTAQGNVAAPGSEVPILDLDPLTTATNHNGGAIHFGPDGKLYVAVGENARAQLAQSLDSRLGKILRINPDGSIPQDNPFASTATGANRAIWALGLRNPFTFDFQAGTGRMLINDVGERTWEEIDAGAPGANFGWPTTEGPTDDPRFAAPVFAYSHASEPDVCAITGGVFYDPTTAQFPAEMVGDYFFADLCGGWIRRFDPASGATSDFAADLPTSVVDLKVDPSGNLYYLARGDGANAGLVGRISRPAPAESPTITRQPADAFAAPGASATFSVEAAGTGPLSFRWQRDGVDIPGATSPTLTIPSVAPADLAASFRVIVANASGAAISRDARLVGPSPVVRAMYLDLLGRPAEPAAVRAGSLYLASGGSPVTLAALLVGTDEARAVLVTRAYRELLGRDPEPSALAGSVAALRGGLPLDELRLRIVGSPEYASRNGGTPARLVQALYRDLLGRAPSRLEQTTLARRLRSGGAASVARSILTGVEARNRQVTLLYARYLRRAPNPAELSTWVAQLRSGFPAEFVPIGLLGSAEYSALAPGLVGP